MSELMSFSSHGVRGRASTDCDFLLLFALLSVIYTSIINRIELALVWEILLWILDYLNEIARCFAKDGYVSRSKFDLLEGLNFCVSKRFFIDIACSTATRLSIVCWTFVVV